MNAHRKVALLLSTSVILTALVSGCVSTSEREPAPGALAVTASWRGGEHLDIIVRNVGGSPMSLSGMSSMRITGPNGTLPLHWNGMAPTLAPGEGRAFELHAMHMDDGTMGMTMDHAMAGTHMPMPPGDYVLRIRGETAIATLE